MQLSSMRRARRVGVGFSAALLLLLAIFGAPASAQAADSETLVSIADNVSPFIQDDPLPTVATPTADKPINITVALNVRDRAGLEAFVYAASDPTNARYHKFLSPAEFAQTYAPLPADAQRIAAYLQGRGMTNISVAPNNMGVSARTTVSQAAAAFNTTMGYVRTDNGRTAYANVTAPRLPASIARNVSGVLGLDDVMQPQTMNVRGNANTPRLKSSPRSTKVGPTSLSYGAMMAADLQYGYRTDKLTSAGVTGAGVNVGIVMWGNYAEDDLDMFVSVNPQAFPNGSPAVVRHLTGDDPRFNDASGETYLDIEAVMTMAPGATTHAYIVPSASFVALYNGINTAVTDGMDIISNSWGGCEVGLPKATLGAYDQMFAASLSQGVTILASAGDSGFAECTKKGKPFASIGFPSDDPYILSVGGTLALVDTSAAPRIVAEQTWSCTLDGTPQTVLKKPTPKQCNRNTGSSAGGGGVSKIYKTPPYQKGIKGLKSGRNTPDISMDADPNSGLEVWGRDNNGQFFSPIGGTSLASPLLAGVLANGVQARNSRYGLAQTTIYGNHVGVDVTFGNNGFAAKKGYDLANGLGSIGGIFNGQGVIGADALIVAMN